MSTSAVSDTETVHSLLSDRNHRNCLSILRALQRFPDSRYFLRPVDPVADGAPDYYFSRIDFQTIEQNLDARSYSLFGFNQDAMQVFTNCFSYNPPGTPVNAMGQRVKQYYIELAMSAFPQYVANLPGVSVDHQPKLAALPPRPPPKPPSVVGSRPRSPSNSRSRSPSPEGHSSVESDRDVSESYSDYAGESQSRKRNRQPRGSPSPSSGAPPPTANGTTFPYPVVSTKPVYAAPRADSPTPQPEVSGNEDGEEDELDEDGNVKKKGKHEGRVCEFCTATETPLWRAGPNGRNTLCNRCGVKWKAGRLLYKNGVYTVIAKGPMQPPRHAPMAKPKAPVVPKLEFDIPYSDKKKLQQVIANADAESVRVAVDIIDRGMSRFRQPVRYLKAGDEEGHGEEYEVDLEKVDGETLRELWEWSKFREAS
ncbi:hypothetical protein HDU93_004830 [Gonapodya sp. JEL0774]|nr:hypothetical protein HDU93_004830 [Gonapodya sp. JEL0774]